MLPFFKRLILGQYQFNHAADRVEGLEESLCVLGLNCIHCLFGQDGDVTLFDFQPVQCPKKLNEKWSTITWTTVSTLKVASCYHPRPLLRHCLCNIHKYLGLSICLASSTVHLAFIINELFFFFPTVYLFVCFGGWVGRGMKDSTLWNNYLFQITC